MSKHMTPIRHQLDDMPLPYNYTGIDENLNGFFTANDTATQLFFDDTSCDKVDGSENNVKSTGVGVKFQNNIFQFFFFHLDQHTKSNPIKYAT